MNWDTVKGDWKQFKGKVKQKWGKLTDDDLDVIEGKPDVPEEVVVPSSSQVYPAGGRPSA